MAENSGFPYIDPQSSQVESCYVVVDENDIPLMACAAERILQLYLWVGEFDHPAAKLHAIRLLQNCAMRHDLQKKGYNEVNSFLPEGIAAKFGRRLERTFGWVKNWHSWALRL